LDKLGGVWKSRF